MSVLPMTTQQWQDQKLGPSWKRSQKWFAVDLYRLHKSIWDAFIPAFEQVGEALAQASDALAGMAEMWEGQS